MIAATGLRTTIVQELARLTGEEIVRAALPLPETNKFVFAAGHLTGKAAAEQSDAEIALAFKVNVCDVISLCEAALFRPDARVVVIGSMSGICGSFDEVYAASKAALHHYAAHRKAGPSQLLCCISPPIISDSAMTKRRHDYPGVLDKRRTVTAEQVAKIAAAFLLGEKTGNHWTTL